MYIEVCLCGVHISKLFYVCLFQNLDSIPDKRFLGYIFSDFSVKNIVFFLDVYSSGSDEYPQCTSMLL